MKRVTAIALMLLGSNAIAQSCNTTQIAPVTPSSSFLDMQNGSTLDLRTGLVWANCALGQTYAKGACSGEASHFSTAYEALNAANRLRSSYMGQRGFRMPSIKELASIVERQCSYPAINISVFPDTPSATFISSTPFPDNTDGSILRTINFSTGEEYTSQVETLRHVRLVKDQL